MNWDFLNKIFCLEEWSTYLFGLALSYPCYLREQKVFMRGLFAHHIICFLWEKISTFDVNWKKWNFQNKNLLFGIPFTKVLLFIWDERLMSLRTDKILNEEKMQREKRILKNRSVSAIRSRRKPLGGFTKNKVVGGQRKKKQKKWCRVRWTKKIEKKTSCWEYTHVLNSLRISRGGRRGRGNVHYAWRGDLSRVYNMYYTHVGRDCALSLGFSPAHFAISSHFSP